MPFASGRRLFRKLRGGSTPDRTPPVEAPKNPFKPACGVFRHKGNLLICPHARDELGPGIFGNLVTVVAITDSIDTIHATVDAAIQTCIANNGVVFPWVRDKTDFGRPLLNAAGVKTWMGFRKAVTEGVGVYVEGDRFGLHTGEGGYRETDRDGVRSAIARLCGIVEQSDTRPTQGC